jgi:hypothetical protein
MTGTASFSRLPNELVPKTYLGRPKITERFSGGWISLLGIQYFGFIWILYLVVGIHFEFEVSDFGF